MSNAETKNRSCALAHVSKCSGKLNREHYISDAVLNLIFTRGKGYIGGLSWTSYEPQPTSAKALTSKILCEGHNSGLTKLDNLAKRYFKAIQDAQLDLQAGTDKSLKLLFSGDDFERWLLKVAFGLWTSGNFASGGNRIEGQPPEQWGRILSGAKFPDMWGLYVKPIEGEFATADKELEVTPLTGSNGNIIGVNFGLARLPFTLLMAKPDYQEAWGIYRPLGISLGNEGAERKLEFSWKASHSDQEISYRRLRDAEPPVAEPPMSPDNSRP